MNSNHIKSIQSIQYYTAAHPMIRSLFRTNGRPTEFGNKVWASSKIVIDYMQEKNFECKRLRVLEIGCGWGLIGIYLAKEFGCQVTCSDKDETVLPIVKCQAELNQVSVEVLQAGFRDLNYEQLKNYDLIIGAEVCYSDEVVEALQELTQIAFTAGVKKILIADPGRPDFSAYETWALNKFKGQTHELPGSVNGKQTYFLELNP